MRIYILEPPPLKNFLIASTIVHLMVMLIHGLVPVTQVAAPVKPPIKIRYVPPAPEASPQKSATLIDAPQLRKIETPRRSELISSIGLIGAFLVYMYVPASRALHLYLIPVAFGALAKVSAVIFAPLFLVYLVLFEKRLSFPESLSLTFWPDVRTVLLRTAPAFLLGALLFFPVFEVFVHFV